MKESNILISAYNINSGGGKLLLESLLNSLPENVNVLLYADSRIRNLDKIKSQKISIVYVHNSLIARTLAEYKMYKISKGFDRHLCLGNLPPLFKSYSRVIVYLHSRYIVDKSLDQEIPFRKYLITLLERAWFRLRLKASQLIVVQTPTMKKLTQKAFGGNLNIKEQAFLPELPILKKKLNSENVFIYVSSFDPHKNHCILLEAWDLLKEEGISPKLLLVFPNVVPDEFKVKVSQKKLNIELLATTNRDELYAAYARANCLIHPSLFESFGIVLIEANRAGLDIIAPESDYVRDIVEPQETFDPKSPISVARSVKRYLKVPEKVVAVTLPSDFWHSL